MIKNRFNYISIILLLVLFCWSIPLFASSIEDAGKKDSIATNKILDSLESRFSSPGFSADFYQESPLPDLGISESANGKAYFKKQEKFRWEYTRPDILHYISDGDTLWIHSPGDNNVWVGKTSTFFGKGSSASFLTDIKSIRKKFTTRRLDTNEKDLWQLELTPSGTTTFGINRIILSINKKSHDIIKIITFNINNEETRITLSNYDFKTTPSDMLFSFEIPEKANVIPLE